MEKMYDALIHDLEEQEIACRERQEWSTALVLCEARAVFRAQRDDMERHHCASINIVDAIKRAIDKFANRDGNT